jgi:hypothetical protein
VVQRPYEQSFHTPDEPHAPHERHAPHGASRDPVGAAQHIPDLIDELREQIAFYASARKDLTSAKVRSGLGKGVLGALAGMVAFSAIVVSVGLLFTGLAQGLGGLFGGRFWLGYVVLGAAVLILIGVAAWIAMHHWRKSSREDTIRRYEDKKQVQQLRHHRDVGELQAQTGVGKQ